MPSYRNYLIILILLFFTGCAKDNNIITIQPNQKVFDKEDEYIVEAINYEINHNYKNALASYSILYKNSQKIEYKINEIKMAIKSKELKKAKELINEGLINHKDNIILLKLLVNIYLLENNYKDANLISLKILHTEQNKENYKLVANSFLINNNYEKALTYLEKAYSYDNDEDILDDIVTILYLYTNQKKKAISYLESHLRLINTDKQLANRLLKIYSSEKDVDGIISVYKLLYEKYNEDIYAKNIVDLYRFKGDTKNLVSFLEKSNYNNKLLISVYQSLGDYKKALNLTKKMYIETKDYSYLAQEAIFEYELLKTKDNDKIIKITEKLETALINIKDEDAVLYNYLGYLYIDHDIDIQKGISWVKKALAMQQNSPYYMDSLAWGYYKINYITKAYNLMKKVVDILGLEDKEVQLHWENINTRYQQIQKKKEAKK